MSRDLPQHPNLEHLKKQAKELLHDVQQRDPAFKLADVQHAIAREYGFSSWPKLKAHVESLPRPAIPAAALVAAPSQSGEDDGVVNGADDPPIDSGGAAAPEKTNPFVGTWTANLSKSRRHPNNLFQSVTLDFDVVGDTVTITDVVVDASGREEHGKNTVQADGKEHPSERGNGYILLARWLGSRVLEAVGKKDGQVVGRGTYEVSADGTILTISADDQLIVCDRVVVGVTPTKAV